MTIKTAITAGDKAFTEDAAKEKALNVTVEAMKTEQLEMNQLLGRIQATTAIGTMLEALGLSQLQAIKEQKSYKQLKGQTQVIGDREYDLGTWEGFCKVIGSTRAAVDERLQNLHLFGEVALENAQNLGMTTRELAKLRKLDPTDQNVIINDLEANIGDKDAIVELIENMSAKHLKDKEELQKQVAEEKAHNADAKANYQALDKVVGDRVKEIANLNKKLTMRESESPHQRAIEPVKELEKMRITMHQFFNGIEPLFDFIDADKELTEVLRITQGQFLLELKGHANRLVDKYELGDVSVDDDGQYDWVAEAKKAVESGDMPAYVTDGVTDWA